MNIQIISPVGTRSTYTPELLRREARSLASRMKQKLLGYSVEILEGEGRVRLRVKLDAGAGTSVEHTIAI